MSEDDDEFMEGCPDCGRDTVTKIEGATVCGYCGWRD
jgi:hypothetical protein